MRTDIDDRKDEIIAWLEAGVSQDECARRLGCNWKTLKSRLTKWGISINQQGWAKDRRIRPLEDYLNGVISISSPALKKRILEEGVREHKCESCRRTNWSCELTNWEAGSIPLHLDHIDGNHSNNMLQNLRLLCPTCHALTPTYCRPKSDSISLVHGPFLESSSEYEPKLNPKPVPRLCTLCSNELGRKTKGNHCKPCYNSNRIPKTEWPSDEELKQLLWERPSTQMAKDLGVSDAAISKRCRKRGIEKPPRGYWTKKAFSKV